MKRTIVFLSLALVLTVTAFAQTSQFNSVKAACGACCGGACTPDSCLHGCGDCCQGK
jgi:hypothetical protein